MAEEALMTPEQLTKTQACDWSVIANWRAKARVVDKRLKEQTGNAFERSKSEGAQEIKVEKWSPGGEESKECWGA